MEGSLFDQIARGLAITPTRRSLGGLLAAAVLLAAGRAENATGKKRRKKKCKPKCGECQACKKGKCKNAADGTSCASADLCEKGKCVPLRCGNGGPCTVFVTDAIKDGELLGGLTGADALCQSTAAGANLPGTYKAWLSSSSSSPANRFSNRDKAGPYRLVRNAGIDGNNLPPLVASSFADLTTCNGAGGACLQNGINRTESGQDAGVDAFVWTGTLENGTPGSQTCGGFTQAGTGVSGEAGETTGIWTNNVFTPCNLSLRLYCFEQA